MKQHASVLFDSSVEECIYISGVTTGGGIESPLWQVWRYLLVTFIRIQ